MKYLLKIIFAILMSGLIFYVYYLINNFLNWPFNKINFVFLALILAIATNPNRKYFWYFFPLVILLESFTAKPFGVLSLSFFISLLSINWLLKNIFTNRSPLIVFLASLFSVFIYRLSILLLLILINFLEQTSYNQIIFNEFIFSSAMEIFITAFPTTLIYLLLRLIFKNLNPKYLSTWQKGGRI